MSKCRLFLELFRSSGNNSGEKSFRTKLLNSPSRLRGARLENNSNFGFASFELPSPASLKGGASRPLTSREQVETSLSAPCRPASCAFACSSSGTHKKFSLRSNFYKAPALTSAQAHAFVQLLCFLFVAENGEFFLGSSRIPEVSLHKELSFCCQTSDKGT